MLHGGVLKATGAYCALRFGVQILPRGAATGSPCRFLLHGRFDLCRRHRLCQTDLKYIIGFSSVSHLGLVLLGFRRA